MTYTYYTYGGIACDEVIRTVWDFLDGEIEHAKKQRIVAHLQRCEHCRDHYAFEGAFLRALGRLVERADEAVSLRHRIETELKKHGFAKRQ